MKITKSKLRTVVSLTFTACVAGAMLYGCQTGPTSTTAPVAEASTQPTFALFGPPPHRTGVQLWSDTCARCHNSRPPETFSGQQWAIIVHHMRTRANLTTEEATEITKFLQASN